jgi:uncharacterized Zn finger protein
VAERPQKGDRQRTSVGEHRATRAIEAGKTNPAWINEALVQCRKDIELARSAAAAGNPKGAVTNAYDAIRAAVACHMNASGLRITNQQGAHVVAVDYAAEAMGDVMDEAKVAQYDQLRRLRHTAEYPFSSPTRIPVTDGRRRRRRLGRAHGGDGHRLVGEEVAQTPVAPGSRAPIEDRFAKISVQFGLRTRIEPPRFGGGSTFRREDGAHAKTEQVPVELRERAVTGVSVAAAQASWQPFSIDLSQTACVAGEKLTSLLTVGEIADLAGPRSYARGVGYHDDGRVELGIVSDDGVEAVVRGTMPYRVAIRVKGRTVDWSCTCPMGEDGEFCKHCVAVALSLQHADKGKKPEARRKAAARRPGIDLRDYVGSLDTTELMDLVMEQVDADWRLRERLTARAAAAAGSGIDERLWRRRLEAAFAPDGGFVDYRDAPTWASGVEDVLDALDELADTGHADTVVTLAEHAHRLADAAVQYIDDSDGWLGGISAHLGELHLRACRAGSPDPVELAPRLVDLELTSELDTFHRAASVYADVLGPLGLAEYRRAVEPRWRKVARKADQWSTERFRLREAMTGIALAVEDPDELARVKQHHLRTPDDYREVAESLRSADRVEEAVEWARRGLEAHADRPWQTPPLRELLAEMLGERGDLDGAVQVFWQAFEAHPSISAYRRLLTEADRAGEGDDWRERAVADLRARVAERHPDDTTARSIVAVTPAVALVEILLHEGDVDAAWETASTYGCTDRLWLTLARARGRDHPLDAIPVYERAAYAQIDTRNNKGYRAAVEHLAAVRKLACQAGEPERFDRVLVDVRAKHKAKRNLAALLDQRGW